MQVRAPPGKTSSTPFRLRSVRSSARWPRHGTKRPTRRWPPNWRSSSQAEASIWRASFDVESCTSVVLRSSRYVARCVFVDLDVAPSRRQCFSFT